MAMSFFFFFKKKTPRHCDERCPLSRLDEIIGSRNSISCSLNLDTRVLDRWQGYRHREILITNRGEAGRLNEKVYGAHMVVAG